jgi:diguanylate cyclase
VDAGLPVVPVAVNISSEEFRGERFVESISVALKSERLDAHYLELELTETVLMWHAESSERTLEKLKAAGVRMAVDDFGTGYSSLSHLMRFAIDAFKLDQSFVRNIVSSSDDAPVVSAVIGMGKSLRHRVIAKGVETPEQFAFLRAQGCDEGQGYYFNRPMMPAQFEKLLANNNPQSQLGADVRSSAGA